MYGYFAQTNLNAVIEIYLRSVFVFETRDLKILAKAVTVVANVLHSK